MARRYAEGTSVSADRTQQEIRQLLRKHGAEQFGFYEDSGGAHIQFGLMGQQYRFTVAKPTANERPSGAQQTWMEREWWRRWRARLLWLKATLEFAVDEGPAEVQRALLAHLLLKDGRTVAQLAESGGLPLLGSGEAR